MKKLIWALAAYAVVAGTLFGVFRGSLDVVSNGAAHSYGAVLARMEQTGWTADSVNRFAPESGSTALVWEASPEGRLALELDLSPFMDAGLNEELFPANYRVAGAARWLTITADWTAALDTRDGLVRAIADQRPEKIGYHAAMGHYNLDLGGGNLFEWAGDWETNDKDVVFALDPAPFLAAGVKPELVAGGWVYAQVPVMEDGAMKDVWKFLRLYDFP
jgi:hypothetical protein